MVQNATEIRRPRGRPQVRSDEETRRLVVDVAAEIIQASGYGATSMAAIASSAGVSTKTLYRLIPNKADLFELVLTERIGSFMLTFDDQELDALDVQTAIERLLVAYGHLTFGDDTLAINRLVIAERDRFPEMAKSFYEKAIVRTSVALTDWLTRRCEKGDLTLDDPHNAATMLRGMMIMDPQRAAMLGQRAAPDAAEIAARAKACAALFLNGCRRRG